MAWWQGGGAGIVLGGLGLAVLGMGLGLGAAVARSGLPQGMGRARAGPIADDPPPSALSAGHGRAAGTRLPSGLRTGSAKASADEAAASEPAELPSRLPPWALAVPQTPVQAEIAAHLRRLATARAARAQAQARREQRAASHGQPQGALPALPGRSAAASATPAAAADDGGLLNLWPERPTTPVVLVADDARTARLALTRVLQPLGWTVAEADNGDQALARLRQSPVDLVVTDADMPGLDGFALTRAIRSDPALHALPVLMLTADDERHRAQAAEAGVSLLIGKPFGEAALVAQLRRLCPRAMARNAAANAGDTPAADNEAALLTTDSSVAPAAALAAIGPQPEATHRATPRDTAVAAFAAAVEAAAAPSSPYPSTCAPAAVDLLLPDAGAEPHPHPPAAAWADADTATDTALDSLPDTAFASAHGPDAQATEAMPTVPALASVQPAPQTVSQPASTREASLAN